MSDATDLFAQVTGDEPIAVAEPASTEAAPAPVDDPSLPDQQETASAVSEEVAGGTAEAAAAVPETDPVVAQETPQPGFPAFDPNDPNQNPHLADAQQMRQLRAAADQIRIARESQEIRNDLNEIADGDPERLQKLHTIIAKVATPLNQQRQQYSQRAESTEKTLAALWIAAEAHLPEDQRKALLAEAEELMQVEGADVMKQRVAGKLEFRKTHQAQLEAKQSEIEDLKRQLAARSELGARDATGADLVDGGTGTVPLDIDPRQAQYDATDMDGYFSVWPGMRQTA